MTAECHCWKDRREDIEETYGFGSPEWAAHAVGGVDGTCMLPDGHEGPHEFADDSKIGVSFPDVPETKGETLCN